MCNVTVDTSHGKRYTTSLLANEAGHEDSRLARAQEDVVVLHAHRDRANDLVRLEIDDRAPSSVRHLTSIGREVR